MVIELVEERDWLFCERTNCPRLFADDCRGDACPLWSPAKIITFWAAIGEVEGFVGATVSRG